MLRYFLEKVTDIRSDIDTNLEICNILKPMLLLHYHHMLLQLLMDEILVDKNVSMFHQDPILLLSLF